MTAKAKALPIEKIEYIDCEQKSPEWYMARLGLATASNFAVIMRDVNDSKTRNELLRKLAGERLTGQPAENYRNAYMERGNEMEAEARDQYARTNFVELQRVGFVKRILPNGDAVGCSPDSLIGKDGGLEIKTMAPHLLIEQILNGTPPPRHRAQLHGTMWVADLKWMDLVIFFRGMPVTPRFRIERDDVYIREIAERVEVFNYELRQLVERIRGMAR